MFPNVSKIYCSPVLGAGVAVGCYNLLDGKEWMLLV